MDTTLPFATRVRAAPLEWSTQSTTEILEALAEEACNQSSEGIRVVVLPVWAPLSVSFPAVGCVVWDLNHADGRAQFEAELGVSHMRDRANSGRVRRRWCGGGASMLRGLVPRAVRSACLRYGWYSRETTTTHNEAAASFWSGETRFTDASVETLALDTPIPDPETGGQDVTRVAVLGGSFHPTTAAHIRLASEVVASGAVGEVWVVPCGRRPDKPSLSTPFEERLAQVAVAIEDEFLPDDPIFAVPAESSTTQAISSFQLLQLLHVQFPQRRFELVIGSDLVSTLPRWRFGAQLRDRVPFLLVDRPGVGADAMAGAESVRRLRRLPPPPGDTSWASLEASSTEIREILEGWHTCGAPLDTLAVRLARLLPSALLTRLLRKHVLGQPML